MKIKTNKLITFLKKVNMQGTDLIEEALFNFSEAGLKISAMNPTKTGRIDAILNSTSFENYEKIDEIGVQGISTLIKLLATFKDVAEIIVSGNLITFKDGKKEVTTELVDTQFITKITDAKDFVFEDKVSIESSEINSTINEVASVNKEFELSFKTVEKGFQISTSGKYKFKQNFVIEDVKGGVDVVFGTPFINAMSHLTGKVELNLKKDFPVLIVEKTEDSIVKIIVTPVIKQK